MSRADTIIVGPLAQELAAKPQDEQLPLLIEYLGTHSQAKIALATHILTGGGPPIVSMLIREAFARGRRPTHAVRLLDVVGQIGGPVGVNNWMLLSAAQAVGDKRLRAKCAELLVGLGHAVDEARPALAPINRQAEDLRDVSDGNADRPAGEDYMPDAAFR
jgi:hypothetical protein